MSKNPRRIPRPVRLIVSVEADTVAAVDDVLEGGASTGTGTVRNSCARLSSAN